MRILIKNLILGLLACVGLSGCMQHNGRIGDWFGTWKLESITVNGTDDTAYAGNIFFQFQTDKVHIIEVDTSVPTTRRDCFGRWEESDGTLILDFSYTADGTASQFIPMTQTLLSHDVNILTIDSKSSKRMEWTLDKTDPSQTVVYKLKKQ